jgi:hypothetical protein
MSDQHFSVVFNGSSLDTHQMDVRDLAPALLALADAVKAANAAINGEHAEVRLDVVGKPKSGSFGIDLTVAQNLFQQFTDLFSGNSVTAVANALALLGALGFIGQKGLIGLLKKLKGRKPVSITPDGDYVKFVLEDSETIEVDLFTGRLYQDRQTRIEMVKVFKPLEKEGVDFLSAGIDGKLEVVCDKDDYATLVASSDVEILLNRQETEQIVLIEAAVFKDGNKWRFNNGQSFHAELQDIEFLRRIDSGSERFGKGDRLRVQLEITQYDILGKLETRYAVLKVIEHFALSKLI